MHCKQLNHIGIFTSWTFDLSIGDYHFSQKGPYYMDIIIGSLQRSFLLYGSLLIFQGPYFTKSLVPIGSLLLSSDVPISFGIIGLHNFVARLVLAQTFIILLRFLSKKLAGETSGTRSQDLEINILSTQAAFCPDEQDQQRPHRDCLDNSNVGLKYTPCSGKWNICDVIVKQVFTKGE